MSVLSLYRAAGALAAPGLGLMLRRRAARGKEDPARLAERRGVSVLPRPPGRLVWLHAASVGETMSILPVIEAIGGDAEILLTTGTLTSARLAAARLPETARHQFVPLDTPGWTAAFLDHWRPSAAVFAESELWPCLLDGCDSRGIPRVLINARMSAGSAANWARLPGLRRRVLGLFRYIHAQSAGDAQILRGLGLTDILEWGNLKFYTPKLPVDEAMLAAFQAQIPGPCWLAASTHAGEEEIIIAAHQQLLVAYPALVTIIVPRHPERGGAVAAMAAAPRRSEGQAPVAGSVYVADTMGELGLFFRAAPFAFIGNSLSGFGGHNLVEPALLARPVITGPHTENFVEAAARLRLAGALAEVSDAMTLAGAVRDWLDDTARAAKAGRAAEAAFDEDGALPQRLAALILDCAL